MSVFGEVIPVFILFVIFCVSPIVFIKVLELVPTSVLVCQK